MTQKPQSNTSGHIAYSWYFDVLCIFEGVSLDQNENIYNFSCTGIGDIKRHVYVFTSNWPETQK